MLMTEIDDRYIPPRLAELKEKITRVKARQEKLEKITSELIKQKIENHKSIVIWGNPFGNRYVCLLTFVLAFLAGYMIYLGEIQSIIASIVLVLISIGVNIYLAKKNQKSFIAINDWGIFFRIKHEVELPWQNVDSMFLKAVSNPKSIMYDDSAITKWKRIPPGIVKEGQSSLVLHVTSHGEEYIFNWENFSIISPKPIDFMNAIYLYWQDHKGKYESETRRG